MNHRNIVKFFQFEKTNEYLYFIMECVSSGSLRKTIQKFGGCFPESLCVIYVIQVIKGLAYLHSRGIVHGDIKADNVKKFIFNFILILILFFYLILFYLILFYFYLFLFLLLFYFLFILFLFFIFIDPFDQRRKSKSC